MPAPYPPRGSLQWDSDLKTYIDTAVAESSAGSSTDAGVAAQVTSGSQTNLALSQTYARRAELVTLLTEPLGATTATKTLVVASSGSGFVYPEHSLVGYQRSAEVFGAIGVTVRRLADGTLVPLTDATIDRTLSNADGTAVTGNVSSLTLAQWNALRIKPLLPGLPSQPTMTWAEVLAHFANKVLIVADLKDTSTAAQATFVDSLLDAGAQGSVIASVATYEIAQDFAVAGLKTMYTSNSVGTGGSNPTFAAVLADGIEFLGVSASANQTYVENAIAAGLKVLITGVTSPADYAARLTWGASGVLSEDPWRVVRSAQPPATLRERFEETHYWPGGQIVASRLPLSVNQVDGGLVATHTGGDLADQASITALGQFGYGVQYPLKIRLKAQAGIAKAGTALTSTTQRNNAWIFSLQVGVKSTGGPFPFVADLASEAWVQVVKRRNGQWSFFSKAAGGVVGSLGNTGPTGVAASSFAVQATDVVTDVAGGPEKEYEIEITPTQIIARNLTDATDVATFSWTPPGTAQSAAQVVLSVRDAGSVIRDVRLSR
jgi:glycerophosphoryl diester phosphodiesterase